MACKFLMKTAAILCPIFCSVYKNVNKLDKAQHIRTSILCIFVFACIVSRFITLLYVLYCVYSVFLFQNICVTSMLEAII